MQIKKVFIHELKEFLNNTRIHGKDNLKAIEHSLKEFEQQEPLLVHKGTNYIISGNARWQVMKSLGWDEVEIVEADMPLERAKALNIAMNKTGDLSEFDENLLSQTLTELKDTGFDIWKLGFDTIELGKLLEEDHDIQEDEAPPLPKETKVQKGDLFILGNHRLLCGDSTDEKQVAYLMGGAKADMVFTDPPYGINFQSNAREKTEKFDVLENDDKIDGSFIKPMLSFCEGWILIFTTWKVLREWIDITQPIGKMQNMIIWDKGGGGMGDLSHSLSTDYEIILAFNQGKEIYGERVGSVWSIGKDNSNTYEHPTQKPVALSTFAIRHLSPNSSSILDLFGGSGSTLIACEQLNRKCFMMELDPHYVQVIIERWQRLTSKDAIHALTGKKWNELNSG